MSIKFTELPVLAPENVADDDILAIVDTSTGTSKQVVAGALRSGRNLIINGSGRINQRGYVSGTATVGANQFTLDRWFVVTSGQNLTFTGTDAGRTMTAPAGGVSQVIEGSNIVGGTYVINWTGTATCTVGGVARAKGDTFTLTANTNTTAKFSSGTFSEVQLEAGSVITPFERVDIGVELAKCQRYYQRAMSTVAFVAASGGNSQQQSGPMFAQMRSTPTLTAISAITTANSSRTLISDSPNGWRHVITAAAPGDTQDIGVLVAIDAELIA
jgi:hypothetical protein